MILSIVESPKEKKMENVDSMKMSSTPVRQKENKEGDPRLGFIHDRHRVEIVLRLQFGKRKTEKKIQGGLHS